MSEKLEVGTTWVLPFTSMTGDPEHQRFEQPALIFGVLVSLAEGVVKRYHSDLYHDAVGLKRQYDEGAMVSGFTFYWAVGECGTSLAFTDGEGWKAVNDVWPEYEKYQVILDGDQRSAYTTSWGLIVRRLA